MFAFRIADARHPIFSATGALLHGGRWNSPGKAVIYSAATYAGALLEILAHANLSNAPANHRVVIITIAEVIPVESLKQEDLPGWHQEDTTTARRFGDRWIDEARTAILRVPGVITGGRESNLLINPLHPQFRLISAGAPEPVYWDRRLFRPR